MTATPIFTACSTTPQPGGTAACSDGRSLRLSDTVVSPKDRKRPFRNWSRKLSEMPVIMETVVSIHENLNEIIEEKKDQPEPPTLTKPEVKNLLGHQRCSGRSTGSF